jgi:hypothetical protein
MQGQASTTRATTATATPAISFHPTDVGVTSEMAETIDAHFELQRDPEAMPRADLPGIALHYGLSFSLGAMTCNGSGNILHCSVRVTFRPAFPGGRKDALFISEGRKRLATILLYGVGKGPLALLQPGVDAVSSPAQAAGISVVDEAGTLFAVNRGNFVSSISRAGVVTPLPVTSSATSIGIDGAGVLYLSERGGTFGVTYDTVQDVEGVLALPSLPPGYVWLSTAVGNTGTTYAVRGSAEPAPGQSAGLGPSPPLLYTVDHGTASAIALSRTGEPGAGAYAMAVDSDNDLLIDGGSRLFRIAHAGGQTEAGSGTSGKAIATDAAGGLYTAVSAWDVLNAATPGLETRTERDLNGVSVGADGTVFLTSAVNRLDVVDRSRGKLDFGDHPADEFSTAQTISIYNGGNMPLTLSGIDVNGSAFSLASAPATTHEINCTVPVVLPPAASCTVAVRFRSPHAGRFTGTLSLSSNSLNNPGSQQTVALTGMTSGPYVTASPSQVTFREQAAGTSSAPLTVTLTNNGINAAVLAVPDRIGSFAVAPGSCAAVLPVGGSCQLSVVFSPQDAAASTTAAITVPLACSGCDARGSVTLNALGIISGSAQIVFSPLSLAFGAKNLGTTTTLPITLTNSGSSAQAISSIQLVGTGIAAFSGSTTCTALLPARASCTISISFKPTAAVSYTASVQVFDCGKSVADMIPITGSGLRAPIVLTIQEVLHLSDTVKISRPTILAIAEAIHVSDTQPVLKPSIVLAVREALHLSDTVVVKPGTVLRIAEALHLSDAVVAKPAVILRIAEALHLSDGTPKLTPSRLLAITEALHLSDAVVAKPAVVLRIAEALHLSDAVVAKPALVLRIAEALHLSDGTPKLTPSRLLAIKEALHLSDAVVAKPAVVLRIAEALHLSDKVALKVPTILAIKEALHLSDAKPVLTRSVRLAIAEVIHTSDKLTTLKPSTRLVVNEALHLSDKLALQVPTILAVKEVLHLSDAAPALRKSVSLAIAEVIHMADQPPRLAPSTVLNVTEAIRLSDTLTLPTPLIINEVLHMSDSPPNLTVPVSLAINEVLHLSDGTPGVMLPTPLVINEVIHASDELTQLAPSTLLMIGEAIHLSDLLTLPTPLAINEVLHLSDAPPGLMLPVPLAINEIIHASDQLTQFAPSTLLTITEAIQVSDLFRLPTPLAINEVLHMSDGAPSLMPPLVLAILEAIHASDVSPQLTPSTLLAISELLHAADGNPAVMPSTVLGINEALHLGDGTPAVATPVILSITEQIGMADGMSQGTGNSQRLTASRR